MSEVLGASPMMTAYAAAQAAAPGHLVLYRVGEFYEVLGQDAATVSRALGLQLTRRRQKDAEDVPMCGIPASALEGATARLLTAGHKVAVSEQPTSPEAERALRRLTMATSVDAGVLAADRSNNLLVAFAEDSFRIAFAWIDISTGESGATTSSLEGCGAALARIAPVEILVARWPEGSDLLATAVRGIGAPFSDLAAGEMGVADPGPPLTAAYGAGWRQRLGGFSPGEVIALALLVDHVRGIVGTVPGSLPPPRRAQMGDTVQIDSPTLRGLEVLTSGSGREGSLLAVLDRTVTAAGARLLAAQLAAPLTNPQRIRRRLAMVRYLVDQAQVRADCQGDLGRMPDVARACGRLSLKKAGPRDLAAVRDGLERAAAIAHRLRAAPDCPPELIAAARDLMLATEGGCAQVAAMLRKALAADLPKSLAEPGFVATGFDSKLDALRAEEDRLRQAVDELQASYVAQTGIKSLRIRSNSVVGYHVEVPAAQAKAIGPEFTLRQGLASSTRFTSERLDKLAAGLEETAARVTAAEQMLFMALANAVMDVREPLGRIAHAAAALDVVAGLAQAAAEGLWVQPQVVEDGRFDIQGARHPVAERLLEAQGRSFVDNDCVIGASNRVWLLTGPNMAGKSTFLRQVALIVLMAQVGSFVPARRATIGVVDKLFSRIGAADDLASGRSTFLVEMQETAAILHGATERSLVILDEVGRGTSTRDGVAIAQATMEHLHDVVRCRALFATHYHELADVADAMPEAVCMAMDATPGRHDDVFTFKVVPGRAGQSYGLRTAAHAGMPQAVLARAEKLMGDSRDALRGS